jgi:anti-sigma factor RsiW
MSFEGQWLPDRPELLAGFVDGELSDAARAEIEALLASDPRVRELYHDQRELSPANWRFWRDVRPREPAESEWQLTQSRIEAELRVPVA